MTHNVMVGLVVSGGEFGYPARTVELARDRGWWGGWSAAGAKRMFLRPNVGYGSWGIGGAPFVWGRQAVADVAFFAEHSLTATDYDSLDGQWATTGPSWYLLAQAQWQGASFDYDAAMRKYCVAAYGVAAAAQGCAYWTYIESLNVSWTSERARALMLDLSALPPYPPTEINKLGRVRVMTAIYTEAVLAQGTTLLEATANACENSGCQQRVGFTKLGLDHAKLLRAALLARRANETDQSLLFVCHDSQACDYGSILPAATALLDFRQEHAATNALQMYQMSREETAWHDITGIAIAAEAARLAPALGGAGGAAASLRIRLPVEVSLAFDPNDQGLQQRWFSPAPKTGSPSWGTAVVGPGAMGQEGWNASAAGQSYYKAHGKAYTGVAWFRSVFAVPASCDADTPLAIASAGISSGSGTGTVRIWLNGQPLPLTGAATDAPFTLAPLDSTTLKRPYATPRWHADCLSAAACRARRTPRDRFKIQTCNVTADCAAGTGVAREHLICGRKLVQCRAGVCTSGATNGTLCVEPAAEPENYLVVRVDGTGAAPTASLGLTNLLWLSEHVS